MRLVEYRDNRNQKKWAYIKDSDPDSMAPQGIPVEPPDLHTLDVDGMLNEMQAALAGQGLLTWKDVERSPLGFAPALTVVKRHLHRLYREGAIS